MQSTAESFIIKMSLSSRIIKHRVIKKDILAVLVNVGGLYAFLMLSIAPVIGFFSKKLLNSSLVKMLFMVNAVDHNLKTPSDQ